MAEIVIDTTDLIRAHEARAILGLRSQSILAVHPVQLGAVDLGPPGRRQLRLYSRRAVQKWRDERPASLTIAAVAQILGLSRYAVSLNPLNSALDPAHRPWGSRGLQREYDPARVERVRQVRAQHLATGAACVPRGVYAAAGLLPSVTPSSVGMAPTLRDPIVRGEQPRQITKPKNSKAARVTEETERVRDRAARQADRKRSRDG